MVILKNIKLSSNGIECSYDPEKSGKRGHIKICMDGEIEEIQFSDYEYGKQAYAAATVHKLRDLLEAGHIPEGATVIWY